MECGSEYSFVPIDRTSKLYCEKLSLLSTMRWQILENLKLFRSDKMPSNPMLKVMFKFDKDPNQNIALEYELVTFFAEGAGSI